MSVAPEGREGVFTAMASAPLFLGKFITGVGSVFVLHNEHHLLKLFVRSFCLDLVKPHFPASVLRAKH